MKEQILRGLLLLRNGEEDGGEEDEQEDELKISSTADISKSISHDTDGLLNDEWIRRDNLIRTGAVTPLDGLASGLSSNIPTRSRMTLMDHKMAEGMEVKLPRSRRRTDRNRKGEARQQSGKGWVSFGASANAPALDSRRFRASSTCVPTESGNMTGKFPSNRNRGTSDDCEPEIPDEEGTWACRMCTLFCSAGVVDCPACGEQQSRKRNQPKPAHTSNGKDGKERALESGSPTSESGVSTRSKIDCPVCKKNVRTGDPTNPDVYMSKHMNMCTRKNERKRPGRQTTSDHRQKGTDGSTSNDQLTQYSGQRKIRVKAPRRSTLQSRNGVVPGNRDGGTAEVTRRDAGCQAVVQSEADVVNTNSVLKVFGGGQLLVDDFDDVQYESRKVRLDFIPSTNCVGVGIGENTSPAATAFELGDGLIMDSGIADRLFQFQITGVRWMWQLHRQGAGGIVGDEMGLGKTVQAASFLGALHGSNVMRRALVLCPATVLSHWMAELHSWAPQLRVVVLHRCVQAFSAVSGSSGKLLVFIRRIMDWPGVVVVTSYEGMKSLKALLLPCNWDYCILDEGQRIRNPDVKVTLICKQIRTVHRLVLTGTPIQNNLRELWSIFDFIFPGRLGTLPAFEAEFANPIRVGGYANTSPMQARLAYRCALVLRDLIHPYLLRRQKKDLQDVINLPEKTEQVLFCRLTLYQRRLYEEFLGSSEVKSVLNRNMRAFRAIGILRKLCNHPDLVCRVGDSVVSRFTSQNVFCESSDNSESDGTGLTEGVNREKTGVAQRSGKLLVLQQILPLWHKQTRQMLNIIERFVSMMGLSHGRLDGNTPVGSRQTLIDRFNNDESIFAMLLTTRTGGVGVNLTGADRVILFDPDWNPSTDIQARERSWRVGQLRQVTVYRLITAGTIEEKIYHRQIFKTALTNRILQDPKQRRIFNSGELGDLFTLGDDGAFDGFTDTVDLFQGEGKIDAPDGGHRESSTEHAGKTSHGRGKSARKKAGKTRKMVNIRQSDESSTNPSSLLGTATVVIKARDGASSNKGSMGGDRDSDKSKGDDSAVLQALYDCAPLSSVFHHDLAEGSRATTVEQKRMEETAKLAAKRALNQLRMSRYTLRAGAGQDGFQSSWTGRNGGASPEASPQAALKRRNRPDGAQIGTGRRFGTVSNSSITHDRQGTGTGYEAGTLGQERPALDSERRNLGSGQCSSAGLTSQDILRQLRLRNGTQPVQSPGLFPELQDSAPSNNKDSYYSSLLQRLQDFLVREPSGIDTAALIHAFGDVLSSDVPVFRQLLQAIAICNSGKWTLLDVPSI